MFHSADDFLVNLIALSPKVARKKFRESIFEAWEYKCAYCEKDLCKLTATIDHIIPKHKGGHNTRNNLACCCSGCNRSKASAMPFEWFNQENRNYSDLRADKLKKWLEQKPCSIKINSSDQAIPYLSNDATIGWIAT
jgi:5-methylcytosine-specific restriction endonuclease McrA